MKVEDFKGRSKIQSERGVEKRRKGDSSTKMKVKVEKIVARPVRGQEEEEEEEVKM